MLSEYAFQPRKWNNRHDDHEVVTGLYGTISDDEFTGAACPAGFLCVMGDGIPEGGHYMSVAEDGAARAIYACWNTDVNRVTAGRNRYAVGAETLGMELPADVKGPFVLVKERMVYAFGPGNFDGDPVSAETPYATIEDGKLKATATEPEAGDGWYFEIDRECGIDVFTEGVRAAAPRYNLMALYA